MINLTQFYTAKLVPNRRDCRCKNCWTDFLDQTPLPKGAYRVVVSTGDWFPSSRHLSLCGPCAIAQAERLENLARELRDAARLAYNAEVPHAS